MLKFAAIQRASAKQPHGTIARHNSGCRCEPCRAAISQYNSMRFKARRAGDYNGIVNAAPAKRHLSFLSRKGVGIRSVAEAGDIPVSTLTKIRRGEKRKIRNHTLRKILAIDKNALAGGALVDSGPTLVLINELVESGYAKQQLAKWLGYRTGNLQFRTARIFLRTAVRVRRLYLKLQAGLLKRTA